MSAAPIDTHADVFSCTLVLQEEHLQLPGWQVQVVHLQEAESQAIFGYVVRFRGFGMRCFERRLMCGGGLRLRTP